MSCKLLPLADVLLLGARCEALGEDLAVLSEQLRNNTIDGAIALALQRHCMVLVRDASQLALSLRLSVQQLEGQVKP